MGNYYLKILVSVSNDYTYRIVQGNITVKNWQHPGREFSIVYRTFEIFRLINAKILRSYVS